MVQRPHSRMVPERTAEKMILSCRPEGLVLPAPIPGRQAVCLVEDSGDYKRIEPDTVIRIYTLDEVCRFIKFWEEKNELVNKVKDTFPGATVTSIKPKEDKMAKKNRSTMTKYRSSLSSEDY